MVLKLVIHCFSDIFPFGVLQIYMVLKPLDLLESPINLLGYYKFTWFSNYSGMFINIFHLFGYYKFTWFSNQIHMILNWMKLAYTKLKHCPFHILYTRLHDSQTRDDVWRWYSCLLSITNLHDSQTQRIHHNLNNSFWVLQIYIILKLTAWNCKMDWSF